MNFGEGVKDLICCNYHKDVANDFCQPVTITLLKKGE